MKFSQVNTIQKVQLWPNTKSLDQNLKQEKRLIQQKIMKTKLQFFNRNTNDFNYQDLLPYLDQSRDIYYPPKTFQPSYCKAGLHYSIPDDVVGIGLNIASEYQDDSKWAVLYHGTKSNHLLNILRQGLKPGHGQAHRGKQDPYGYKIPNGVYFSFWVNQSYGYTLPNNPIILQSFVKDVFVAPGHKGYAISNTHSLSRILIPLQKDRKQQLI